MRQGAFRDTHLMHARTHAGLVVVTSFMRPSFAGQLPTFLRPDPCLSPFTADARAAAQGAGKAEALAQSQASASTLRCIYPPCNPLLTPPDCCGANNAGRLAAKTCGCIG